MLPSSGFVFMPPIRVLIADDHPAFSSGLRSYLDRDDRFTVLGEAADGHRALAEARRLQPDVLVLDLDMPGLNGLEVTQQLSGSDPEIRILILSAYEDDAYVFGVLEHGASGYLTKQESLGTIVDAICGVAKGETGWLSRKIAALLVGQRTRSAASDELFESLSEREREVLRLVAHGHGNHEIGERLFIAESTVKKHLTSTFEKLDVTTRTQAAVWMWTHGLVESSDGE